ncbi:MAG TPA: hypothetical protein VJT73_12125 [Polyangiaceae bacterium]|nr:hypothetical protein [Polyangiaceae bacterium]
MRFDPVSLLSLSLAILSMACGRERSASTVGQAGDGAAGEEDGARAGIDADGPSPDDALPESRFDDRFAEPDAALSSGGSVASGPPRMAIDRPRPPSWDPPIRLGTSGWRSSTETFCTPNRGLLNEYSLWSDPRGVYVLASDGCNPLADAPCGEEGFVLQVNDGGGWRLLYDTGVAATSTRLTGFVGGPLVIIDNGCGIGLFDNGTFTCEAPVVSVAHVFPIDDQLAYATDENRLLRRDAGRWVHVATVDERITALWADHDRILLAGRHQAVFEKRGEGPITRLSAVPAGDYSAVWGFGTAEIWLGNTAAQLVHFDGSTWLTFPASSSEAGSRDGISGVWGSQGQLYYYTRHEFGRWNGTAVELLLPRLAGSQGSTPRLSYFSIWGNSPNEVFIALTDSTFVSYACAGLITMWFDGNTFHQF